MENLDELSGLLLPDWMIATGLPLLSMMLMWVVSRLVLGHLSRLAGRTSFFFDGLMISALRLPIAVLILALNLIFLERLLRYYDIAPEMLESLTDNGARILLILALVLLFDGIAKGCIDHYSRTLPVLRNSRGITMILTRALVLGIGVLILLGTLGISITPLIASLGITSLAVALALQPTLENFFSGVQILIDKPIQVGNYIELESGEQGFVEKIGWRSTWIKMLPNNTVIMPNSRISSSKLINYDYPQKELSVLVEVGVHYDSDLEQVEKVTTEVAKQVLRESEYGVSDFGTFMVYHSFDSSSINFTVILRGHQFTDSFQIKHLFIKALHARYREEGITIPYPIRALNTSQEGAVLAAAAMGTTDS